MQISRRSLFRKSGAALGVAGLTRLELFSQQKQPDAFADLKSMTAGVKPHEPADYEARIEKARKLMINAKIDLLCLNGGTSLDYFGAIRWGLSERMFAMLIPARGEIAYVCPKFEEGRAREQVKYGTDIRTWEEDQDPYLLVKQILQDRKIASGIVGVEPTVREFVVDAMQKACTTARFVNGENISQGCRSIKSKKELEYMTIACNITKRAFEAGFRTMREGMTQRELSANMSQATSRLGATGGGSVSFGPSSGNPHGSLAERTLKAGDVVLVDGGCKVEGLSSDVTRTVVFGKPSDKVRKIWDIVLKAQTAALAAVRPGVPCEAIDAAARKVIVDAGYGPDYKYFAHRVGHGIGMDGHEYPYLVRGNKLPLAPGMTFSDEPGIYIANEFGVRIEDTFYVAEDGGHFFGNPIAAFPAY